MPDVIVTVTDHAVDRIRKRLGIPRRAALRTAERAFHHGVPHTRFSGPLRDYLDHKVEAPHPANSARVYGEFLYMFEGAVLRTVWDLPVFFRNALRRGRGVA